jgi:hypothetical protein
MGRLRRAVVVGCWNPKIKVPYEVGEKGSRMRELESDEIAPKKGG